MEKTFRKVNINRQYSI